MDGLDLLNSAKSALGGIPNPLDLVNGAKDSITNALGFGRSSSAKGTYLASTSLDDFKASALKTGFAEEDRFEVVFTAPKCIANTQYASFVFGAILNVEQASIPGTSIFTKQQHVFGPGEQRPMMIDFGGDGLSLTFLLDRDMNTKRVFDSWMRYIVDEDAFTVAYPDEYTCRMEIRQLDRNNAVVYTAVIEDAFPKSMLPIAVSSTAVGQFQRLNISFAYRKWYVLDMKDTKKVEQMEQTSLFSKINELKGQVVTQIQQAQAAILEKINF
jgi:hypothetical protein